MSTLLFSSFLAFAFFLSANADGQATQFGYWGVIGPANWGGLNRAFAKCADGKMQSPINIRRTATAYNRGLGSLTTYYHPANASLINHQFRLAVAYDKDAGVAIIDGKNYTLKQMHWHTPSEHRLDGIQYAAELHLVHYAEDNTIAAVAILYRYGNEDSFISKMKDKLDELIKVTRNEETIEIPAGEVDPTSVTDNTSEYYRYKGSLTSPPCTEEVKWTVLSKVQSMSVSQVNSLRAPLRWNCKANARPVQALNGRKVEVHH